MSWFNFNVPPGGAARLGITALMKEFFFKLAVAGYLACGFLAMLYASTLTMFRPTEPFVGMTLCAIIAVLSCSKARRLIVILALLFSLGGSLDCWHYNGQFHASMQKLRQPPAADGVEQHTR